MAVVSPRAAGRRARLLAQRAVVAARRRGAALTVLSIGIGVFLLRAIRIGTSWDVFVDEITYYRLSQGVAQHLDVQLYGRPFYLHPPVFFFLEGGYLELARPGGDLIDRVEACRFLVAALAGISAILIVLIARLLGAVVADARRPTSDRATPRRREAEGRFVAPRRALRLAHLVAPAVAVALFAIDPFIVKLNSRNYMETAAMLWLLAGYWLLLREIVRGGASLRRSACISAGLLFGGALLTKEMTALLSILPLTAATFATRALARRAYATVVGTAVGVYMIYPVTVALSGGWGAWESVKLHGLRRFAGQAQETGFNQPNGPSFTGAIVGNLDQFAVTYVVIAAAACTLPFLFRLRSRAIRLLATWGACSFVVLAFSVGQGTLEEQFFYYLVVPSILLVAVAAQLAVTRFDGSRRTMTPLLAASALLLLSLAWSTAVWGQVHSASDDGYRHALTYVDGHVPPRAPVAVTTEAAQFLFGGVSTGIWVTPSALCRNRARFVVVSSYQRYHGYGYAKPDFYDWVDRNGTKVYTWRSRTGNTVAVYHIPGTRCDTALHTGSVTPTVGSTLRAFGRPLVLSGAAPSIQRTR
jgi:hypothetical protein